MDPHRGQRPSPRRRYSVFNKERQMSKVAIHIVVICLLWIFQYHIFGAPAPLLKKNKHKYNAIVGLWYAQQPVRIMFCADGTYDETWYGGNRYTGKWQRHESDPNKFRVQCWRIETISNDSTNLILNYEVNIDKGTIRLLAYEIIMYRTPTEVENK